MREYMPLDREASMQELVAHWGVPYHVLSRILRTRQIGPTRREHNKHVYSPAAQAEIAEAVRFHTLAPRFLKRDETLAVLRQQERRVTDIDHYRHQAEEARAMVDVMTERRDQLLVLTRLVEQLQTWALQTSRDSLPSFDAKLGEIVAAVKGVQTTQEAFTDAHNALRDSVDALSHAHNSWVQGVDARLKDWEGKLGGLFIIAETRLQALEAEASPTDDTRVLEARQRGADQLQAYDNAVALQQAEHAATEGA